MSGPRPAVVKAHRRSGWGLLLLGLRQVLQPCKGGRSLIHKMTRPPHTGRRNTTIRHTWYSSDDILQTREETVRKGISLNKNRTSFSRRQTAQPSSGHDPLHSSPQEVRSSIDLSPENTNNCDLSCQPMRNQNHGLLRVMHPAAPDAKVAGTCVMKEAGESVCREGHR